MTWTAAAILLALIAVILEPFAAGPGLPRIFWGVVGALVLARAVDDARLAQELAILADKLDITEELVRFASHLSACRAALAGDAAVGKQLGFLSQELGRETNTMGSKANDADIAQQVILMKGEMEKFREQLENLE